MFLEAQFGAENLTPIATPKINLTKALPGSPATARDDENGENGAEEGDDEIATLEREEIERLHKLGIPVPGVEIKVDKMVAKVWLEDLEVECANRVFGDRVRAVVERAVEVTAPLWA
jgi:cleavage and polyadenylation specificity factor subunit 3